MCGVILQLLSEFFFTVRERLFRYKWHNFTFSVNNPIDLCYAWKSRIIKYISYMTKKIVSEIMSKNLKCSGEIDSQYLNIDF